MSSAITSTTSIHTSMTTGRVINAYVTEAKYAFLRVMRSPAFAIPTLVFPLFFYLLIGYVFGAFKAKNPLFDMPTYIFCGFATMAAMTPGMFGFGIGLALEREQGLFTLKRALPMPPFASILGSVVMSMISTFMATIILAVVASFLGLITLSFANTAAVITTVMIGAIPFAAIGLLLGVLTSGRAAPAVVNVVYILLTYFSGLFFPLAANLKAVSYGSPAFYLHQLTLEVAGSKSNLIGGVWAHVAVLLGVTAICLTFAKRRLERAG